MSASSVIRSYYQLTKPGIIYGNLLTAAAGFLLATTGRRISYSLFAALLLGVSLVIASACVVNNYLDRNLDRTMRRTKQRALVLGTISPVQALGYAAVLGLGGLAALIAFTNALTVTIGLIAFIDYVVLYGWSKRHSVYGTLVGSVSGAAPIVAGYTAVTDRFDGGALLLFLILTCWQMPHFYAIALYRYDDYKAAGLPVLPLAKGVRAAKLQILSYIAAFMLAVVLLTVFGYTGYTYLVIMGGVSLLWLWRGLKKVGSSDFRAWGRSMFLFSLIVIMSLSVMTAVGGRLP